MSGTDTDVTALKQRLEQERRNRALAAVRAGAIWVLLPTVLAAVYLTFIASPQFKSVAIVTVGSGSESSSNSRPDPVRDALTLRDLMGSADMLAHLDANAGFSQHYTSADVDWMSRLSASAGSETRLASYQKNVELYVDERSGNVHITVIAFDPDAAPRLANALIDRTRELVAGLDNDRRSQALDAAAAEVDRARTALPAPVASDSVPDFEGRVAEESYRLAVRALADARRQDLAQQRRLDVLAAPSAPDQPAGPLKLRAVFTTGALALFLYLIVSLLLASVRDHARM